MPDRRSVIYALRGVISMAISLFIAMYLNLDRPYWALISAVFLQFRPESGLVIEKAICQVVGTLVGGIVGIIILNTLMGFPILAIIAAGLWIGFCSTMSALVRRINFIYAYAMAGITSTIIIILVVVQWPNINSQTVFTIAQARMSEIIIGAVCAAIISLLFWPSKIKDHLITQANTVANQTLSYLSVELADEASHEARHQYIDKILQSLTELSDDSSGVVFEGPNGAGHLRAINLFCNKILTLLATIQIFGRLKREHPELLTQSLTKLLEKMQSNFYDIRQSNDFEYCYQLAQKQRRMIAEYQLSTIPQTALEARLLKVALEFASDLTMVLKAYRAIEEPDNTLLRSPSLRTHRDIYVSLTRGFRSALSFWIGSFIWFETSSSAAVMLMLLPVVFSIMMARMPLMLVSMVLRRLLIGVCIAIPVTIFYDLSLLIQSGAYFEILILIFAGPLFIGLLCLANRPTMPYGIGFSITYIVLVRPSTNMSTSFSIDYTLSAALGIFVGVFMLYWLFQLITGPSRQLLQYRLVKATYNDLKHIPDHPHPKNWFNQHMGDRLLRIVNSDQNSKSRALTDLGLTGLNLGHISIRLSRYISQLSGTLLRPQLKNWQDALADAFLACSQGETAPQFVTACDTLVSALVAIQGENAQTELIKGSFERIQLTFERTARLFQPEQTISQSSSS
ncbi:FUSC family protein [Celerinatantimonas sp. YJH-8]|uniref:FUSC family protein n=1 Tax=Celerinatantimonas sp. YJH-8 TaxID=3228714 RepID=UPI0038CBA369